MMRIALTAFRKTPKLAIADPRTVFASVLTASQFGWEIGLHCYLVPFRNERRNALECQLIPGWRGLTDLASRSGRSSSWTGAIYEGDDFRWSLGDKPFLRHQPCGEDDIAKLTHAYAIGRVSGADFPVIEVQTIAKILKHRDKYNRVGKDHYSYEHLEMYARKVCLLQVLKYLPQSAELQTACQLEYDSEVGNPQTYVLPEIEATIPVDAEWIPEKPPTQTEAVKEAIKGKEEKPTEVK